MPMSELIATLRQDLNRLAAFRIASGEWQPAEAQEIGLTIRAIIAGKDADTITAWAGWVSGLGATYHGPTPIIPRPGTHVCTTCRHWTKRGKLDAYCATRNDLPPVYGPGHPLQHLPADSGASCAQWSQA